MHLEEKMTSSETAYAGRIFKVTHDIVTLEDGREAEE